MAKSLVSGHQRPNFSRTLTAIAYLLLAWSSTSFAQGPEAAWDSDESDTESKRSLVPLLRYDTFFTVPKLPAVTVRAVHEDDHGIAWFGTDAGLAFWDGDRVTAIDSVDTLITAIDSDGGILWVGTLKGLMRVDLGAKNQVTTFLGGSEILAIAHTRAGVFASTEDGVFLVDAAGKTAAVHESAEPVMALLASGEEVWMGAQDGSVSLLSGENIKENFNIGSAVNALAFHDNKLHVGTSELGVYRLDGDQLVPLEELEPMEVRALASSGGDLWVGLNEGLWRVSKGSAHIYQERPWDVNGIVYPRILSLAAGRDGGLLIGAFVGASMLARNLDAIERFVTRSPLGLFSSASSLIKAGPYVWGGQTGAFFRVDEAFKSIEFFDSLQTADGQVIDPYLPVAMYYDGKRIWCSTDKEGLLSIDTTTLVVDLVGERLQIPLAMGYLEHEGLLLIASYGGGLMAYDPKADTAASFAQPDDRFSMLIAVAIDSRGRILVAGDQGVGRIESGTDIIKPLGSQDQSIHVNIMKVWQDKIYVGATDQGLLVLDEDGKVVERYDRSNGLAGNIVETLLRDDRGNLWIGTLNSVQVLTTTNQLLTILGGEHFAGGLDENIQLAQTESQGDLLLGTTRGFFRLSPTLLDTEAPPRSVVFTDIKVVGETRAFGKAPWEQPRIEVPAAESAITVRFAYLPADGAAEVEYQYRLRGLQDSWWPTTDPYAPFSNLPGGEYTLEVRAKKPDGGWSEPALLTVVVNPHWYKTWWAYTLYALSLVLALGMVFRFQRSEIRRLEREKRIQSLEADIELSAVIQEGFLPPNALFEMDGARISGYYQAAEKCSGDWWWYEVGDDGRLLFVVGDVTGHGLGPAMVTAALAASFRTSKDQDIMERLERAHIEVRRASSGNFAVSGVAVILDPNTGEYEVFSAAGMPLLQLTPGKKAQAVPVSGKLLGGDDFGVGHRTGQLEPGDRLLAYTDGIIEAPLVGQRRQYGLRAFAKEFAQVSKESPFETTVGQLVASARGLVEPVQDDDWTLVLVEYKDKAAKPSAQVS